MPKKISRYLIIFLISQFILFGIVWTAYTYILTTPAFSLYMLKESIILKNTNLFRRFFDTKAVAENVVNELLGYEYEFYIYPHDELVKDLASIYPVAAFLVKSDRLELLHIQNVAINGDLATVTLKEYTKDQVDNLSLYSYFFQNRFEQKGDGIIITMRKGNDFTWTVVNIVPYDFFKKYSQ